MRRRALSLPPGHAVGSARETSVRALAATRGPRFTEPHVTPPRLPYRDELGAAVERADGLARENVELRWRLRAHQAATLNKWLMWHGIDWVRSAMVAFMAACVAAIVYIIVG